MEADTSETDRSHSPVAGREAELALLSAILHGAAAARALLLVGDQGIGKTTIWEAGINDARGWGACVLSSRPTEEEAGFSFAGLTDLLEPVSPAVLASLPPPQREALAVALLRAQPGPTPPPPRAVATGALGVLRALAAGAPVVVAIDDVQWLDAASAQALAFAARRLDREPVRFLLTRRTGERSSLEEAFPTSDLARLDVTGLGLDAIGGLLVERLGLRLSRRVLRQVFEASGGNPLYALELARQLAERGQLEVGEELPVPDALADLVRERVARLSPALRRALLSAALSPGLDRARLVALTNTAVVGDAVAGGLLLIEGERVRAAHPLLAAAARAHAAPLELRSLHEELAEVLDEEELRARHLALAAEGADAALAARLANASRRAAARGAVGDAVDLAEQALRLTPPAAPSRPERLLRLAERLEVAGELARAHELLSREWDTLPPGGDRARAHLLLAETDFQLVHAEVAGAHYERALDESAADPGLHALATARWSRYLTAVRVARIAEAERRLSAVLGEARRTGPDLEREVLYALAFARILQGRPIDDLRARYAAVSPDSFTLLRGVERIVAEQLTVRGRLREARAEFLRLMALADERGEAWSAIWLLHQRCELELRAGEWAEAERLLHECEASPDRPLMDPDGFTRCRALLAAGRGQTMDAARLATETIESCRARGRVWNLLEASRAAGMAALLDHEPARAAEHLTAVWEHTERQGVLEPGEFPVAPDLVEALVELGRLDDAVSVCARLRELATAWEHPWAAATADRCQALLTLARAHDRDALDQLAAAAGAYAGLGLRFDHARTLLAGGRLSRRRRMWGAARDLLEQAAAAFIDLGSPGWAVEAQHELSRIGGRSRNERGGLSPTEQRVVELAAAGLSNKEIAARLAISEHTVERHLTHAYGKLGIQTRTQLASRLFPPK